MALGGSALRAARVLAAFNGSDTTVAATNVTEFVKPPRFFGGSAGSWFFFVLFYLGGPVIAGLTWKLYSTSKGDKKGCQTIGCHEKKPVWWVTAALLSTTWLFLVMYEMFGPGINSTKVLLNVGTSQNILPDIAAGMTEGMAPTVDEWLDP